MYMIYDGIFFVNTSQTKEHCESSALLFGNEAHLRCMKNEAAFGYEALLRNMKNKKCALRFMAWVRRFTEAVRLLLHIDEGDASLTKQWFYVILNPERRRYGKMFSVF